MSTRRGLVAFGGLFRLNVRSLSRHRTRHVLSVVSVAVGVMLITAVGATYLSIRNASAAVYEVVGDPDAVLVGRTDRGMASSVVRDVRRLGSVGRAVPAALRPATVAGEHSLLVGLDSRAVPLLDQATLDALGRAQTLDGVVLQRSFAEDIGVEAGDRVDVAGGTRRPQALPVAAVIDAPLRQGSGVSRLVGAPLDAVQDLAGSAGRVDAVFVFAVEGLGDTLRADLRRAVGDRADVTTTQELADRDAAQTLPLQVALALVAGAALAVGGFFVFNVTSVSMTERRHEVGVIRVLGARRHVLSAGFLAEPLAFGLVGATAGAALGALFTGVVLRSTPDFLLPQIPTAMEVTAPLPFLAAMVVLGTVAALLGGVLPVVTSVGRQGAETLRESSSSVRADTRTPHPARAAAAGAVTVGAGMVLLTGDDELAAMAGMALVILGGLLMSRILLPAAAALVATIGRRAGPASALAGAAVRGAPVRIWATTATVALAVALVVVVQGVQRDTERATSSNINALGAIDLYVDAAVQGTLPTGRTLPADLAPAVAAEPGVRSVVPGRFSYAMAGNHRVLLQGVGGRSATAMFSGASPRARSAVLEGTGIVASRILADQLGLAPGSTLVLATGDGTARLPVADVVDYLGAGLQGVATMSLDTLTDVVGRGGHSYLEITAERGADVGSLRAGLSAVVRRFDPIAKVRTGDDVVEESTSAVEQLYAIFGGIQWIVVGAAALSIFNSLTIAGVLRRREVGVLRAVGARPSTVRRMFFTEAVILGLGGATVGLAFGLLLHWSSDRVMSAVTHFPVEFSPLPSALVVGFAGAVTATVLGGLAPAMRSAQGNVVEAIAYE